MKVFPSNYLAAIFSLQMFFSLSFLQSFWAFKFPARMLIGNFDKSFMRSKAVAPLLKNGHKGSFFACMTMPIVIIVEPFSFPQTS